MRRIERLKNRLAMLAAVSAVAFALQAQNAAGADSHPLLGTTWKMTKVQGVGVSEGTVVFEADKISGTSGCNSYWAGITYGDGASIDIGPPQSARVYCPGVMTIERAMFASLETVTSYQIEGKTLKLALEDGDVFLEFIRAAPPAKQ